MPNWIRIKLLVQPAKATVNDLRALASHLQTFNSMCPADDITRDFLNEVQPDVTENMVSALSKINKTQEQMNEMSKRFFEHQKERNQRQHPSGNFNENRNTSPKNQYSVDWRTTTAKFMEIPATGVFPNHW